MHVKEIKATVPMVKGVAVKAGGFMRQHKRLTIAVVVAALLLGPLVTTDGELVFLNAVGLGLGALLLRRFIRPRGRQWTGRARETVRVRAAAQLPRVVVVMARRGRTARHSHGRRLARPSGLVIIVGWRALG